jgi:hypothetical protein
MHHPQYVMLASLCLASRSQEIWLIRLCVTSAAWTSILHCRRSKQANRSTQQFLHDKFVGSAAAHSRRAVMRSQSGAGFWPRFPPPIPHSCGKKKTEGRRRRRRAWKTNKHTTNCTPVVRAVRSATISKPQPCRKQDVTQEHKNQCWAMIPGRTTARTRTSA